MSDSSYVHLPSSSVRSYHHSHSGVQSTQQYSSGNFYQTASIQRYPVPPFSSNNSSGTYWNGSEHYKNPTPPYLESSNSSMSPRYVYSQSQSYSSPSPSLSSYSTSTQDDSIQYYDSSPSHNKTASIEPRGSDIQHSWIQTGDVTSSKDLSRHIQELYHDGVRSFFCCWPGCQHPIGFILKPQLVNHIRSAHLQEKPFLCVACNSKFARKQDANRHVITMNQGKQYKCSVCQQAYSRKHHRDVHEERCLAKE